MKKKVAKKKKEAAPKSKKCPTCKKPYFDCHEEVDFMGEKICLHDENLRVFDHVHGSPITASPAGIGIGGGGTLKEERNGRDSRERKYIEECHRRGNKVFRGDDGLLREIGTK